MLAADSRNRSRNPTRRSVPDAGRGRARGRAQWAACPEPAPDGDAGRATIEVVFLAVLLLIPTIYILIALVRVQAANFAVTQAARDAGRLLDTAPSTDIGLAQAREAAAIALTDQHISPDSITIRFAEPGADCSTGTESPPPTPAGAMVDVCVTTVISLPGVPTVLTGSNNTVTGVYTLHVGEFRERR